MKATARDSVSEALWRDAFDALAAAVPDFAGMAKRLLTGFAACVDKLIDLHAMAPALKREPAGRVLFDELMARARAGRGGEVQVDWPDGPKFLDPFAKPGATAIGGTSAQAASTLACLGAPAVMALDDRSVEQLAVLHPAIKLIGEDGALVPVGDVRPAGAGKPAHYIVEYSAGRPLPDFTPKRSTRIIVRFADEDLEYDAMFERYGRALGAGAGAALLSSPNAVGAERLPRALDLMASFALAWKDAGINVHLELGEYPVPGALDETLRRMAGSVTSIGLNFNELRSIGLEPAALEGQMAAFAERHGLSRLVVHADPWALALTREDPERELDALAMGCLLASARAEAGRPVAKPHAPAAAAFARPPRAPISTCAGSGWHIVCCPAPYLRNPASAVGLGDTFTAGTMLVHGGQKAAGGARQSPRLSRPVRRGQEPGRSVIRSFRREQNAELIMAAVSLRGVVKSFGAVRVIQDVDLEIGDGEFVVLVGPSGCGKSTLLRMVAGLETINSGEVLIGGEIVNDMSPKERNIAMVFQSYALYPHMTVRENLGFSLKLSRAPRAEAAAKIQRAADILGLGDLLERKPRELSGGQRQRVAMGRAIVRDPAAFLFDEPLSNLDAALRVQMRVELAELHHRLAATMIYVTHDQVEAMTMAQKIAVLNKGRVEQFATPAEVYNRPRNLFVARFIGSPQMNILQGRVTGARDGHVAVALAGGDELTVSSGPVPPLPGSRVQIGIRPEALMPADVGVLSGTVRIVEYLGGLTMVHVARDAEDPIVVQLPGSFHANIGDTVRFDAAASGVHLFDAGGLRMAGGPP